MALVNINEGLKEEYSMNKTFSAEYDFSCVRQIARADRFVCVLTHARAIAHVKRKGLMMVNLSITLINFLCFFLPNIWLILELVLWDYVHYN